MKYERVADLLDRRKMGLGELIASTGVEKRVVQAIVHQRYTPSPEQRDRVSGVLGVRRERIVWGHSALVDGDIPGPT